MADRLLQRMFRAVEMLSSIMKWSFGSPRDSSALVNALEELINRSDDLVSLGSRGRELVMEKFSEDVAVRQIIKIIDSITE